MFVLSWKHSRGKAVAATVVVVAVVAGIWAIVAFRNSPPKAEYAGGQYSLSASTAEERMAFFKQFGWEVAPEPIDSGEVTIPETFNDVYLAYNNIQKEQGLDLLPYAGRTVQQWIYRVTNFPQQKTMRGTILVCNGKVIGGDLSTPEISGFMTGFDGQKRDSDGYMKPLEPERDSMGQLTNGAALSSEPADSAEAAEKPSSSAIPANAWPTD